MKLTEKMYILYNCTLSAHIQLLFDISKLKVLHLLEQSKHIYK